jgi:hypothetical protein
MQSIFGEAVASIKNANKLTPTELKNAINGKVWQIIRSGNSAEAVRVRAAFASIGAHDVPGQGFRLGAAPSSPATPATPATPAARPSAVGEIGAATPFPELAPPPMSGGARLLAAGGGALNAAGGVLMLASVDPERDPALLTAGKVTSGGASLIGGGSMLAGGLLGDASLVAFGGAASGVGMIIAAPIMVHEMRPRGWIAIDPMLVNRALERRRNGENVNAFCAQCHGPGGALDPNNDWNAGGARRAAMINRIQWMYLGD